MSTKKYELYVYNLLFYVSMLYTFLVPYEKQQYFNKITILLVFISLPVVLKKKYGLIIVLIASLYTILFYYFRQELNSVMLYSILLIALYYIKQKESNKIYKKNLIILICLASLIYQSTIYRFNSRIVLSYIDPNYSGFYYFLLYMFLDFEKKNNLKLILFILGLLTFSRNFLLAVFIYEILKIKKIEQLIFKIRMNSFFKLIIFSNLLLIIVSHIYVHNYAYLQTEIKLDESINRLITVLDSSNYYRMLSYNKICEFIFTKEAIFGVSEAFYTEKIFKNIPHNMLSIILYHGLLYFLFIVYFINSFFEFNSKNLKVYLGVMVYLTFLSGTFLVGMNIIVLFYLINTFLKGVEIEKNINVVS